METGRFPIYFSKIAVKMICDANLMNLYFDSSALVKRHLGERGTTAMKQVFETPCNWLLQSHGRMDSAKM